MIVEHRFNSATECFEKCGEDIAASLQEAILRQGSAKFVASGGRTAKGVVPLVAKAALDWSKIDVSLADERCVPIDHPERNQGLIERCLRSGGASPKSFKGLLDSKGDTVCLDGAAKNPDVLFLGMGEDGHIASLFPGVSYKEEIRMVVKSTAPMGIADRVSLSPQALLGAKAIFLVVTGEEKRRVLDVAKQGDDSMKLPVRLILEQDKAPVNVYSAKIFNGPH